MTTARELEKAIDDGWEDEYDGRKFRVHGEYFWSEAESYDEPFEIPGIGSVTVEDYSYGSETDNGLYVILKVGDQYFRKNGVNISHDGWYWDGRIYEVVPVQKTITDWKHV